LDVSVQAQILNLLREMKARHHLTMVFISHDLAVVKNVSDRVAVMYLGKLAELAPADEIYRHPGHPYTRALLEAVPVPDPTVEVGEVNMLAGELPSPGNPPSGCRFRTRCPIAQDKCAAQEPPLIEREPEHYIACHFPLR
jgi:peptide/nickel transport system ATP-binding protein